MGAGDAPKHVEQLSDKINSVTCAYCCIYIRILLWWTDPWTLNSLHCYHRYWFVNPRHSISFPHVTPFSTTMVLSPLVARLENFCSTTAKLDHVTYVNTLSFIPVLFGPWATSSSSSIGTTARCGLWPVEQYLSIFPYLSPTLSIFSLPTLEDLFLLLLSILSWVFLFVLSLPVLEWTSFWASYPPPISPGDPANCWRKRMLLVGPPMPDRSRVITQTKKR
jgi:hypothetical protein